MEVMQPQQGNSSSQQSNLSSQQSNSSSQQSNSSKTSVKSSQGFPLEESEVSMAVETQAPLK